MDTKVFLPPVTSAWKQFWAQPKMMQYHRLFVLVCLVNIAVLIYGVTTGGWWQGQGIQLNVLANVVVFNFAAAILIRQHYMVNLMFWVATRVPKHWPLAIRRRMGKVYHFGGIHSAGATAGTIWYVILLGSMVWTWQHSPQLISDVTLAISAALMVLLMAIITTALPKIRARYHNQFELMHRLGGWISLGLFGAQFLSLTRDLSPAGAFADIIIDSPALWLLSLITFSIVLPWTRLKKVPIKVIKPSSHVAIAYFDYGVTPFAGSSMTISRSPLKEWHAFANIPTPGCSGYRLAVSRAGDWTGQFIDDTPSHVWVKAIPTAGVGNIDQLFKRVIWVATGSGVGPCLPHMLANYTPSQLVWSTRNPRETFGDELVDEILAVQPHAMIWDTTEKGKPDMLELAWEAYHRFDAEAVICISNPKLTWLLVSGLESRNIPAYGAIWDS
ncbi:MAG: hypothetical protein GY696_01800 [Gammaproteobacteria bacterium]|nr:hypothetical protein [Gammaproteobacteria bacterium]